MIYGLANDVRVEFSVTAHSAVGSGVASEVQVASPVGSPEAPGVPRSIKATPTDTTVFIQWAAPLVDGGAPITAYIVDCGASLTGEANKGCGLRLASVLSVPRILTAPPLAVPLLKSPCQSPGSG